MTIVLFCGATAARQSGY